MHIIQSPLSDFEAFIAKEDNNHPATVLETIPAEGLFLMEQEYWAAT
jgi:hypothetical protein